jgi:hypothetical protein
MTTAIRQLNSLPSERRATPRPAVTAAAPVRREYRERDFGVGYGRSSGYASDRRYASNWSGPTLFRCG